MNLEHNPQCRLVCFYGAESRTQGPEHTIQILTPTYIPKPWANFQRSLL